MTRFKLSDAYIQGVLARKAPIYAQERQLGRWILATLVAIVVLEYALIALLMIWG